MKKEEFIDILDELIAVDTDEGIVASTAISGSTITVKLNDGAQFEVCVKIVA